MSVIINFSTINEHKKTEARKIKKNLEALSTTDCKICSLIEVVFMKSIRPNKFV